MRSIIRLMVCIMRDNDELWRGKDNRLTPSQAIELLVEKRVAVFSHEVKYSFWDHFNSGHGTCTDKCFFTRSKYDININ